MNGNFEKSLQILLNPAKMLSERSRRKRLGRHHINPDKISEGVVIFYIENVKIGPNTYMNSGRIYAGEKAKVTIGDWCAIGYNVTISATTHDPETPTGPNRKGIEKDIAIGDHVWIGNNVYIKDGISIGSHVIVGANAVVTKNVQDYAVVGGVPAKVLYYRKKKTTQ
jgi:maltose O-acetyltransferase